MAAKTKGGKSTESEKEDLDEQELESLYSWVDSVPLSRPKKNIGRDFSDGVLVAEIVHHYFPSLVEMHNYSSANSSDKKMENWLVLNRKVFSKLNFELADDVITDLACCKPGMIEKVLLMLQVKIRRAEYGRARQSDKPEADQHHHHHHDSMTPGRKDSKIKVGMDETKGRGFAKTKQRITKSRLDVNAPVRFIKDKQTKSESKKKVKFIDEKESTSKTERRVPDQKSAPKMPPKPVTIPKKRPGQVVESDMVPRYVSEEKEQEILSRDETIQILQAKISRLEHLLHLKDMRIEDLQSRVESMRPTGIKK